MQVGLSPLNTEWTRQNEYEVHQTSNSQLYSKYHSNRLKTLWDNRRNSFCFLALLWPWIKFKISVDYYQNVELNNIYYHTNFAPDWFINLQMHANVKVFDTVTKTTVISLVSLNLTKKWYQSYVMLWPPSVKFDHGSTSWLSCLFDCCSVACGCRDRYGRNNLWKLTNISRILRYLGRGRGIRVFSLHWFNFHSDQWKSVRKN